MEPEFTAGKTVYYVDSDNFIEEAAVVMTMSWLIEKRTIQSEKFSIEELVLQKRMNRKFRLSFLFSDSPGDEMLNLVDRDAHNARDLTIEHPLTYIARKCVKLW